MAGQSLAAPLRGPDFRWIWVGGIVSNLGTMVQTVGAGWLMATIVLSSETVALVQSATTLPIMLFSIVAGVFADSYNRKRVLVVAQLWMMAVSLALAGAVIGGWITPGLLLVLTFLLGCGTALHMPAWQASVGDLVARKDIPAAVTLNSMAMNMTRSVGPALGGVVVATAGAAMAFVINAVSYVPMILALLRWRTETKPATLPREDFRRAVSSGVRYVAMSPRILRVITRAFVFGLTAVSVLALMPLIARDLVGGGAVVFGLLLGCFGIGALGGGLLNARLRERLSAEGIARGAFLGFSICTVLLSVNRDIWLACLLLLPAGAAWVLALSLFNVVVQLSTPRWVVGRTLSFYQTATFGGMTAGAWIWGLLAEAYGTPTALFLAGVACCAGASVGLVYGIPKLELINLDPLNRFREPRLQMDITPRSGPVRILVEYEIPYENVERFLEIIAERRRIRLRDGARHWVLLRDLESPTLWKESYHFPTWAEYIRHHERPTQADAEVSERLKSLTKDKRRPQVRRLIERHRLPSAKDLLIGANPDIQ